MENPLLSLYPEKITEYVLAISYLAMFVMYWRWVNGAKPPGYHLAREATAGAGAHAAVAAAAHAPLPGRTSVPVPALQGARQGEGAIASVTAGWFTVPEDVLLHPGHTWAREEANGVVTIGIDDFAHKLVGPVTRVETADLGETVSQGAPAIKLGVDGKTVTLLSPIDGTVLSVNRNAEQDPATLDEPYAGGWLLKVRARSFEKNRKQLLSGVAARRWMEGSAELLAARLEPQLGHVLQDGGTPVHGIGREIDPEGWDELARSFFLT